MRRFQKCIKKYAGVLMGSILFVATLTGCGQSEAVSEGQQETVAEESGEVTITFMNGEEELGKATANAGELLVEESYVVYQESGDAEFLGWYETPSFLESSNKDLGVDTFTKDTTLYGCFKSSQIAEDTRIWYLAGTSTKGSLKDNNWADTGVAEELKETFQLKTTGNATNEFAITIDLFEGDQFQIIHDWVWDGQKGFGCFTDVDASCMESGGGLGGTDATANVNVIMDGNYTITLTTDPDNAAMDTLTVVRNGDPIVVAEESAEEAYVVSDTTEIMVKGSWVADWSEVKELTREDGTNEFAITMELAADTEICFMVYDNGEDTGLVLKEENVTEENSLALLADNGNNIQVAEDGNYTFVVNADDMSVVITK
ncbi:MAG: hypothetical protein IJO97_08785 [Lachnospiraceae bacterium]|nr:hypothetical protein [Lachnospiraceae bacterium]